MSGAPPVVTVDGPAGSGKTTLGRRLAAALRLPLVDTGLVYRGVMVAAVRAGIDATDPEAAAALAARTRIELNTDADADPGAWRLRVDGSDAGELMRDPRRATLLAELAALRGVRAAVLEGQRRLAAGGAVAVGRDCGTVVFPDAALKLFLCAAPAVRAARRSAELRAAGTSLDAAVLEAEIGGRDALDEGRVTAPLRPAADAHRLDTGRLGIEAMTAAALALCRQAGLLGDGRRP